MIINEKALVKAMAERFKGSGYTVAVGSGRIWLVGLQWTVWCRADKLPRKALGLIVEHLGEIQADNTAYQLSKQMGCQKKLYEQVVPPEEAIATSVEGGERAVRSGLTMNGWDLWQGTKTGRMRGLDPSRENLWIPKERCATDGKWMGTCDDESGVYIQLEQLSFEDQKKLEHLEEFKWFAEE